MTDPGQTAVLCKRLQALRPVLLSGRVRRTVGQLIEADGPPVAVGTLCDIDTPAGKLTAEVMGFRDGVTMLFPISDLLRFLTLFRLQKRNIS